MIPISAAPKRFVAALNKDRFNAILFGKRYSSTIEKNFKLVPNITVGNKDAPNPIHIAPFASQQSMSLSTAVQVDQMPNRYRVPEISCTRSLEKSSPREVITMPKFNLYGPRTLDWYTGKAPVPGMCPGVSTVDGYLYSLPQVTFAKGHVTRESLQAYFDNTWTLTEVLFAALQGEEAFMRPPYHDLRHPLIFYYGHPAALYINKLRVAGLLKDPINAYFEAIFETGVDEMSWDDLSKNKMPWPSVETVHAYRQTVYETVSRVIANITEEQLANFTQSSPLWSLVMAFEHERIHIETSSFLMTELPIQYLKFPKHFPAYHPTANIKPKDTVTHLPVEGHALPEAVLANKVTEPVAGVHYPVNHLIPVAGQTVALGKPRDYASFGWDNEYGHREYTIPAFKASQFKITNGEFHEFVKDGGYATREHWTEIGWKWRAFRNVKWPSLWVRSGPQGKHEYDLRLIFDEATMAWDWPVVVNYHEAKAFAAWKSSKTGKKLRLMTEPEHHAIRGPESDSAESSLPADPTAQASGEEMLKRFGYNTNLAYGSMSPVSALQPNALGFSDVFGSAWEWQEDYFCALPGFQVHRYYEDFSTPCFDGLHYVIQGGSFISTGNEASKFARFHFRPHFTQHASFRLVESSVEEEKLITSDLDAPAPYVGNYPFRQSQMKLSQKMAQDQVQEEEKMIHSLLSKHYSGDNQPLLGDKFTLRTIGAMIERYFPTMVTNQTSNHALKILEVGCGVGGLTFQLASNYAQATVIGVDHHAEVINLAKKLLSSSPVAADEPAVVSYELYGEGDRKVTYPVSVNTSAIQAAKVEFKNCDPMCLPAEWKGFDLVVLHDVLDKVSSPNAILGRLGGVRGLVKEKGGILAIISAFAWNENRTPKTLWLGGYPDEKTGRMIRSEETLKTRLTPSSQAASQAAMAAGDSGESGDFSFLTEESVPVFWKESESSMSGKVYSVMFFKRM